MSADCSRSSSDAASCARRRCSAAAAAAIRQLRQLLRDLDEARRVLRALQAGRTIRRDYYGPVLTPEQIAALDEADEADLAAMSPAERAAAERAADELESVRGQLGDAP